MADLEQHLRHLQLPVVTRINKEESIGVGSYASVYEVMVHGTLCAAKEMHPVLVNDTNKRAFLSECAQSSRILHPNVVQFLGIYYPSPRARLPWMVMELMYISLRGLIEKYEKDDFPFHFKLSILIDICHGLQFLHSQNIIHRDLSSNNILLTKHLVAKISDLGMAKVIPPSLQKHTQAPGTVVFMPPEALSVNPQYGKPIDVFSVGCVCVHVISMEWPTPLDQVVNNVVLSEVQRRERYFTKMIPSLEQLVERCLEDKPEQRPVIEEVSRGLKNINYDHQPHEDDNIIDLFTSALKCSSQDEQMATIHKDQQLMSQLVEKDEQLSKKDQRLIEKDQQISQKDQLIYQKDELLFQKDQQKDQMLHQKDQEILEKEQRLYQKDQVIIQKDQQLYQKDQIIYEKDQLIKQKDQEIMEKEKQISRSKSLNKVS